MNKKNIQAAEKKEQLYSPSRPKVYGIGNPLIDIMIPAEDYDLRHLGLFKGTMHLIDEERRQELLDFIMDGNTKEKSCSYSCGGSAPNTLVALSSFGVTTVLAGKVGADEYGDLYDKKLKERGVISDISQGTEPTGSSIIFVCPDGERTMNTFLGANRELGPDNISSDLIAQADYLYFTGYMWDTETQKNAVMAAIETARAHDTKIVFDLADPFAVSRNREKFLSLIKEYVYCAFANAEEARILFDHYEPGSCARSLAEICPVGVVKDGKRGSYVCTDEKLLKIPVKGKEALDSTGAGDMYAAGFLLGLCKNLDLYQAGSMASFLAGEIVCRFGAQFTADETAELQPKVDSYL